MRFKTKMDDMDIEIQLCKGKLHQAKRDKDFKEVKKLEKILKIFAGNR